MRVVCARRMCFIQLALAAATHTQCVRIHAYSNRMRASHVLYTASVGSCQTAIQLALAAANCMQLALAAANCMQLALEAANCMQLALEAAKQLYS
jgi:hypothetical protein